MYKSGVFRGVFVVNGSSLDKKVDALKMGYQVLENLLFSACASLSSGQMGGLIIVIGPPFGGGPCLYDPCLASSSPWRIRLDQPLFQLCHE
jgi:hypothetical protein